MSTKIASTIEQPRNRVVALSLVFGLSVFALVYGAYPFDGMVLEESWNLYPYRVTSFFGEETRVEGANSSFWLFTRRGGYYAICALLASVGSTPTLVNILCIAVQAANLILFAFIAWKLAGTVRLFPILLVAILYPFASGAHFWQISIVHHLAMLFFFASFALFLRLASSPDGYRRDVLLYGLPGLVCYWLSLAIMEFAILMPVLFVYLALYYTNRCSALLRFSRWWSPTIAVSLGYVVVSVVFGGLILVQGYSRVTILSPANAGRFGEWGALFHIPPIAVAGLVAGLHAILFLLQALLANSIGYLGYPLMAIMEHGSILAAEVKNWGGGVVFVSLVGAWSLYFLRSHPDNLSNQKSVPSRFLVTVGVLWALLAYLPMASSLAYARVVGQIADRINELALFGVSLCLGEVVTRLTAVANKDRPVRTVVTFVGCFLGSTILLVNLYLQREYWVEGYQKELKIVIEVLNRVGREPVNGRKPLVLLDRDQKVDSPRVRLQRALQEPEAFAKLLSIAKVVLARHFTKGGEIEMTSFHLRGIPLFSGGPDGGWVFNHYAKYFSMEPVLVFRMESGVVLQSDADSLFLVGYAEAGYTRGGLYPEIRFPRHEYEPVILKLDESLFQFRGPATYRVQPNAMLSGAQ